MSSQLEKLGIFDIHSNLMSSLYFKEKLVFYTVPILKSSFLGLIQLTILKYKLGFQGSCELENVKTEVI